MPKRGGKRKEWDYPSLEWIHRAREAHYEAERGRPLSKMKPQLSPQAVTVAQRLKLNKTRASELSRTRRRVG